MNKYLLFIFLVISIVGNTFFSCSKKSEPEYTTILINNGTEIEIKRYNGNETDIIIPDSFDGLPVTSIGYMAFYMRKNIEKITLPETITRIGESAFGGNSLKQLIIPDSVIFIGERAFSANKITSLIIGNSVESIAKEAFMSNQIIELIFPDSVQRIGEGAFARNRISSVVFGKNLREIGREAFIYNQLESVNLPGTFYPGFDAFRYNPMTTYVSSDEDFDYYKERSYENRQYIFSWGRDYHEETKQALDNNEYARFEAIGWSNNGLFAYRGRILEDIIPAFDYRLVIINTINNEIVEMDNFIMFMGMEEYEGSNLAENYRDEYRIKWNGILAKHNINGRITDPFSNNFESNILLFPIDNFNVWFDYLYNPYDAEIGEFPYGYIDYKVIIGNGNNQNIAAERRIANYGNFDGKKILGYYRSPYQNRIIIVAYNYYTYYHGPGGYLTLYGFNLGLLN